MSVIIVAAAIERSPLPPGGGGVMPLVDMGEVVVPCTDGGALWFSDDPEEVEAAKWRCGPCPLRAACLAGALERGEVCGVWGGELLVDGTVVPRKRRRGRPRREQYPSPVGQQRAVA